MQQLLRNWSLQRSQKAVEAAPDDAKAWSKLYGQSLEQNRAVEFLNFCREVIYRTPDHQQPWKFLRMASEGQVSDADAIAFARQVVRLHPECERAWSHLDTASEKLADAGDWIVFCRELTKQCPNNMHAWSRLMRELKNEAKHADLVSACLHAIKVKPDAQTWVNLADAYSAQSKFEEAITAYEKALELKSDYLVAINGLACVFHTQGRMEEAIALYTRATKLRKEDATPWVWLALAHMQTGELQKARDAIGKVKSTLPLVAQMLTEELSTLPEPPQVADKRVPVSRFTLPDPA